MSWADLFLKFGIINEVFEKPTWSSDLTKNLLMLIHQEVWVSILGEDEIMRINRETAYKTSATWRKEYRQAWIW